MLNSIPFSRLHLFELEDQPWFPVIIRDLATDYLSFVQSVFGLERPILRVLTNALRISGCRQIVDLCSGAGGLVYSLQKGLGAAGLETRIVLTDKFPNLQGFALLKRRSRGRISFVRKSVDARFVPDELRGFRTMFNSFHHFAESDAKQILQSAVEAAQPIAIFEYPQRNALIILLTFVLTPLLVALATPFIRPFRCSRLVFTYLLPVIPLTCWWDGIVSHLRAYTAEELQRLAEYADGDGSFVWCAGRILVPYLPAHLTFLVGHPIGNGNCEIQARKASMRLRWHASALPQLILRALRQTLGIRVRDFSHARKRMPRSEMGCNFTRASQFCAGRCESP